MKSKTAKSNQGPKSKPAPKTVKAKEKTPAPPVDAVAEIKALSAVARQRRDALDARTGGRYHALLAFRDSLSELLKISEGERTYSDQAAAEADELALLRIERGAADARNDLLTKNCDVPDSWLVTPLALSVNRPIWRQGSWLLCFAGVEDRAAVYRLWHDVDARVTRLWYAPEKIEEAAGKVRAKKNRGRKPHRDHRRDKQIYDARKTTGLSVTEIAREFKCSDLEVTKAIDSHRKRLARMGK